MSDIRPLYNRYRMTSRRSYTDPDRPNRVNDEEVDAEFVIRFCKAETREFFERLGGTETYSNVRDYRMVRSISPDGAEERFTIFEPLYNSGKRDA